LPHKNSTITFLFYFVYHQGVY